MRQAVPLQPREDHGGADLHLQPGEDPMPEQGDARRRLWPHGKPPLEQAPGRTCGPMERGAHAGVGFLAGLVTPRKGPTLEQSVPEGLQPIEGTYAGAICEELQLVGRTHAKEVCGGLSPIGGTLR